MQARPEALQATLARQSPAVVWVHGDEPLLTIESADLARSALRKAGYSDRIVFDVDRFFKPAALDAEANELSLFADRKLLELRCSGKPTKELGQALADTAARAGEDVRMLVTSPRLDRATLQTPWASALDPLTLWVAVYPVERDALPRWIGERLARQSQQADATTLALIADRVEGNLLAAYQEVQKLALLCPPGPLDPEAVRAAVLNVARYDPNDLVDAMLAGEAERALRCLDGLRAEGEAEPLVLWAVSDAVRKMAQALRMVDDGRAAQAALRDVRVYPPRDRVFERALRQALAGGNGSGRDPGQSASRAAARFEHALQQAGTADRIIKGLTPGDAWQALRNLVAGVASDATLAALDLN